MAYGADLAYVHDAGFGHIARGAAATLCERLVAAGLREGVVVELACGSGISSRLLCEAGYDVLGYDSSPQMVELARANAPAARFQVASLYDVELPDSTTAPCVAVTAIGEAFNYLFDERAGSASLAAVVGRAWDALVPGGLLMFDVAQPGRALPRLEHTGFEGPGWRVAVEVVEAPAERRLERRIQLWRDDGAGGERRDDELHELVLYDSEEVFGLLRAAGFRVTQLAGYGQEYVFTAGHGGYLAVKPARGAADAS